MLTELNILDGITLSTSELNILDGVTSSTSELNIQTQVLELNYSDGVTSNIQTQFDNIVTLTGVKLVLQLLEPLLELQSVIIKMSRLSSKNSKHS